MENLGEGADRVNYGKLENRAIEYWQLVFSLSYRA